MAPISFGSAGVLRSPPRVFGPTAALGFAAFGFAPGGCVHSRWWRFSPRFLTADRAVFSSRERARASAAVVALSRALAPLASASASAARAAASASAALRCVACTLSLAWLFCLLPFLVDRPYPLICDRGQVSAEKRTVGGGRRHGRTCVGAGRAAGTWENCRRARPPQERVPGCQNRKSQSFVAVSTHPLVEPPSETSVWGYGITSGKARHTEAKKKLNLQHSTQVPLKRGGEPRYGADGGG